MRVVCPNGQQMGFSEWMANAPDLARARSGWIGLSVVERLAAEAVVPEASCRTECRRCEDGAWICQGCAREENRRDEAPESESPRSERDRGGDEGRNPG